MEINIKYIFTFKFIFCFFMLPVCVVFFIWLTAKIKETVKGFRSFVNYICTAFIPFWIYQSFIAFLEELPYFSRFDGDFMLHVVSLVLMIDAGTWIIFKFMQAYTKRNAYKHTDADHPQKIKNEIEFLVNDQNFTQNAEMEKLYKTLQISALSIKKQKKIIRSGFLKNLLLSIFFFLLGLVIPKLFMLLCFPF